MRMSRSRSLIILDFDGTLADTTGMLIRIINRLADEFAYRKIRVQDLHRLRSMRSRDILAYLNIPVIRLPFIIRRIRAEMSREIPLLRPSVNIRPTLEALRSEGHTLGILTNNSISNVREFLRNNDLELFSFIRSTHYLLAKHIILRRIRRLHEGRCGNGNLVFYVGDEARDVEAGRRAGTKTVAVSWGFNSREVLLAERPDYIVDEPEELEHIASNAALCK